MQGGVGGGQAESIWDRVAAMATQENRASFVLRTAVISQLFPRTPSVSSEMGDQWPSDFRQLCPDIAQMRLPWYGMHDRVYTPPSIVPFPLALLSLPLLENAQHPVFLVRSPYRFFPLRGMAPFSIQFVLAVRVMMPRRFSNRVGTRGAQV